VDNLVGWLVFALMIAAFIGWVVWGSYREAQRRKALMAWAAQRGLTFQAANRPDFDSHYGFNCLVQGENRYAYNVMEGQNGNRSIRAFDYHYETHSTNSKGGRTTTHYYFSAVIIETGLPLKPLYVREESFFDKVGEFLGFEAVHFELQAFNDTFHVTAEDKKWAFDVFNQATMEFLLGAPHFSLEMKGTRLIAFRSSTFGPKSFDAALDVMSGVLDRLPPYLLRELKGET
jgi:hypothetical protein